MFDISLFGSVLADIVTVLSLCTAAVLSGGGV